MGQYKNRIYTMCVYLNVCALCVIYAHINKKNNRAQTTIIHMSSSLPYFYLRIVHIQRFLHWLSAQYIYLCVSVSYWSADDSHQKICATIKLMRGKRHSFHTLKMPLFGYFQLFWQIFMLHLNVAVTGCTAVVPSIRLPWTHRSGGTVQTKWTQMTEKWEKEKRKKREKLSRQTKFATITKKISHKIWYLRVCVFLRESVWMRNVVYDSIETDSQFLVNVLKLSMQKQNLLKFNHL